MDNAVRRAVIVEDSPQMRELIRMVLGSLGFQKIVQAEVAPSIRTDWRQK